MTFRSLVRPFTSERGQVLLSSIVFSAGVILASGFLLQQSYQSERTLRIPRIKSIMSSIEAKVRLASLQPQTFTCPLTATATFNSSLCTLSTTFAELTEAVPGCQNAGPTCGVVVQNPVLAGTTLTATVIYQGTELAIAPIQLSISVPPDVLQASDYNCASIDPTKPLFAGFNPDGSLICKPLPSDCPAGQYASGVSSTNLSLSCAALPTPANSCSLHQYMTSVNWAGGPTFTVTCAPRLNPFTFFTFTPTLTVKTTPYSSPTPAPANGACVPIPTTTAAPTTTTTIAATTTTNPVTTTTFGCTPGPLVDTGCIGPNVMGTSDGCTSSSRIDATCAAPTTTTTTVPTADCYYEQGFWNVFACDQKSVGPFTDCVGHQPAAIPAHPGCAAQNLACHCDGIPAATTLPPTTTTTTSTTTTTAVACGGSGAYSWAGGGADDTRCVDISPWPLANPSPNPWCCSGTQHPTFGGTDTMGGGTCYWICN